MPTPSLFLRSVVLAFAISGCSLHALADDDIVAESPDHPMTWVNGAIRAHQGLRWSPEKHMLYGDVTYSTAVYADGTQPTREDDFSLAFPTVHLDPASGNFTAHGVVVARLHHGLFGSSVDLAPNTVLSIHRHHGAIYGKLLTASDLQTDGSWR